MRGSRIFWGIVLAVAGLVLLLLNLGLLPGEFWGLLWAFGLIVLGAWLLLTPLLYRREKATKTLSIPVEDLRDAEIQMEHGAGRLEIRAASDAGYSLLEGTFTGGVESIVRKDGTTGWLNLKVPGDMFWGAPWMTHPEGIHWNIGLNRSIPLRLRIKMGAGENRLDLADLQVKDLQIETGASSTWLRLPAAAGHTRAVIKSGAAAMEVHIPETVAARIEVKSGLSSVVVDQTRFVQQGSVYQSVDFDTAVHRVDILAETGVGSLEIR